MGAAWQSFDNRDAELERDQVIASLHLDTQRDESLKAQRAQLRIDLTNNNRQLVVEATYLRNAMLQRLGPNSDTDVGRWTVQGGVSSQRAFYLEKLAARLPQ